VKVIVLARLPSSQKVGSYRARANAWSIPPRPPPLRHVCFRTIPRLDTIDDSGGKMKVTIKEWNAVAAWRWDMPDDDVCGICRNPYDSTCSKCKFPGDDCPLRMSSVFSGAGNGC
jgi:hypothetical protein